MIVRLERAGPVHAAELDLSKRLIVLAGPNGAGKTWLAWALYGLHRGRRELPIVRTLVEELLTSPELRISLVERWETLSGRLLEDLAKAAPAQLRACFGTGQGLGTVAVSYRALEEKPDRFADGWGLHTSVGVAETVDGVVRLALPGWAKSPPEADATLHAFFRDPNPSANPLLAESRRTLRTLDSDQQETLIQSLTRWLDEVLVSLLGLDSAEIFPAERLAINLFAREIAGKRTELVDELLGFRSISDAAAHLRRYAARLPRPIQDNVVLSVGLGRYTEHSTPFSALAEMLERRVMGGTIDLSESGDLQFHDPGSPDTPIPLHLTASAVKSVASLAFYFRHRANRGDLLIIDEPELNLHPDNQRRIAQVIAIAANNGLRIVLSTHSDWFLRELNRLLLASQLPEAELPEHGLDPAMTLRPQDVGVYLLQGGESQAVPVDERGFSVATIDAETNRLAEAEQRMHQRLYGD